MGKAILLALSMILLTTSPGSGAQVAEEGCQAVNPAQPKCSFTVTMDSTSGVVTGAVGQGEWTVLVKRGKEKIRFGPSGSDPEPVSFDYAIGDKVTVVVKNAGGWVVAGHD
jgi:hypothetical protein